MKFKYVTLIFLYTHLETHSMARTFASLKKNCTLTSIAAGIASCAYDLKRNKHYQKEILSLPDASPIIQKYAQESLIPLGMKHITNVSVKIDTHESNTNARAFKNIIILGPTDFYEALLTSRQYEHPALLAFKATLQHEGGHIKHHHNEKQIIFDAARISFSLFLALKNHTLVGNIIAWSFTIPANFHERQADESIEDNPAVLLARAKKFREYALQYDKEFTILEQLMDVHPHPLKRAQRLEKRARALLSK